MKKNAVDIFACPISKGKLSLLSIEETRIDLTESDLNRAEKSGIQEEAISPTVKEGILYCEESSTWYPIINHVPIRNFYHWRTIQFNLML